ncbi:hypothetical protein CONCODRAFT_76883 [Conidiobolus coronatus NRRL 28638]|uniref:Uncharacterized protein n=1 Tax=Conidiobolus coronatus (strain ATCC 28846 / CBS 209.66 / NRRL 28638) TaxID=796925 RepID=A0A137PH93_CONC2|nr:hypothetical protein CONCODRAFT_76883 [Conidiobolus coronatus NRRL 28638]|eukprot:KXN74350.1 hypothetical protein CONCODRAFT_76883 [Conidiobolus coronatus NRRL 28638]
MYSEEIKYLSSCSDENTHFNKIRNGYFMNRSCLTNVLDFLDQEVVIVPRCYFSTVEGSADIKEDCFIYSDDDELNDLVTYAARDMDFEDNIHLCVLDNYVTIVPQNRRCIFTNKDMEEGDIIGTVFWVKNYSEILKKFSDRNLKMISKAILHPLINHPFPRNPTHVKLDENFFLSMEIYKPEVIFKYNIDTYMANICIDIYNKLVKSGLNVLVDKYIPSYKQCDGYGEKGIKNIYEEKYCKCGGLRTFCYLDI